MALTSRVSTSTGLIEENERDVRVANHVAGRHEDRGAAGDLPGGLHVVSQEDAERRGRAFPVTCGPVGGHTIVSDVTETQWRAVRSTSGAMSVPVQRESAPTSRATTAGSRPLSDTPETISVWSTVTGDADDPLGAGACGAQAPPVPARMSANAVERAPRVFDDFMRATSCGWRPLSDPVPRSIPRKCRTIAIPPSGTATRSADTANRV